MVLAKDTRKEEKVKSKQDYESEFDTKDPTGQVKEIERRTSYYLRKDESWRNEAKEDFRFALGDQWTTEDKNKLAEEGRPALTFNKIESLLDLVGGWQRENSTRIKIFPEGGEDQKFSEIGDKCLSQIDKTTHLNYKIDHQFDDGITCGKGFVEMAVSYERDVIHGELIFRNLTVYQVLKDPESSEYDLSDCEDIIKLTELTKEKLKKLFPEKKDIIENLIEDNLDYLTIRGTMKEGDADNYHLGKTYKDSEDALLDAEKPTFLLKERWHKRYIPVWYLFDARTNKLEEFSSQEAADARSEMLKKEYQADYEKAVKEYQTIIIPTTQAVQMAEGKPAPLPEPPTQEEDQIRIFQRSKTEMWYHATAASELLQEDIRSPFSPHYEGFPIFPYFAKWSISAEDMALAIKGIVRNLKDPQREINKSRSQFLHILNTAANSGWVGDNNALSSAGWKDLKKMGSTPGVVIKKKPGSFLEKIEPSGVSMGQKIREEQAGQDIKEISGINPDALAIQDKTTSGRAISLRIKQALTILAKYFRNFRWTKEMIGQAIFSMIPEIFDVASLKRLLGPDFMQKNQVDDAYLKAFLQQIKDSRYDVNITEADNTATIRQETFENLMELAKSGYPIPPDVILEFSSMPNSTELVKRVQAYIEQQQAGAQKKA